MTCPVCGGQTHITDSRMTDVDRVRRRRECVECGHRFSTLEFEVDALKRMGVQKLGHFRT